MERVDDGLWRTLARLYTAIAACGVCVPVAASIPALVGFDSFLPTLLFGAAGIGLAGGVTYVVDAQLAAVAARRATAATGPAGRDGRPRAPGETGARTGK
jgi:hypothetical protein